MTTSINWPPSLPTAPTPQGYAEDGGAHIARAPMDAGPPKMRKLGTRADLMPITFRLTTAQVATFETFVKTTTGGGVKRFNFTHPRTAASKEVRFVPEQDGKIYRITYIGPGLWLVAMTFEVLP